MKTRIFSIVLVLVMLLSVVSLAGCGKNKAFNYAKNDLSGYFSFENEDYKKLPVEIETNVNKAAVINKILENLKGLDDEKKEAIFVSDREVAENDVVALYYRGVTYDKDANESEFPGNTNLGKEAADLLWIGSDFFIEGFEEKLIGIKPENTSITERTEGEVAENDVVVLDITGIYSDGEKTYMKYENLAVKLSETTILSEDIIAELVGKRIGEKLIFDLELDADGDKLKDAVIFTAEVKKALDITAEKISVKFPDDYSESSLAGKDAYFYVVIESLTTMDKATIEALGFTSETDDALTEYKKSVEAELVRKYAEDQAKEEDNFKALVENYIWSAILENAKVDTYPAGTVERYVAVEIENLEYEYYASANADGYQKQYKTFEDFAKANYGTDYEKAIEEQAKRAIKGKLVLYSLAKEMGFDKVSKKDKAEVKKLLKEEGLSYYTQYYTLYNSIFGYGLSEDDIKSLADIAAQEYADSRSDTYLTETAMKTKILDEIYKDYNTDFDNGLITWTAVAEAEEDAETENDNETELN